jgi:hypothetical protein
VQTVGLLAVGEVFAFGPALTEEDIAEAACVSHHTRRIASFRGAGIQPDFGSGAVDGVIADHAENDAVAPPDGRREDSQFSEDFRVAQTYVERYQTAEGRSPQTRALGRVDGAVVGVDERLNFFDEHGGIEAGFAAVTAVRIGGGRVFVDAMRTCVVDANHDERLDGAFADHALCNLVGMPLLAAIGGFGIEEILAIVEIKHGIAARGIACVVGRKIDDDVPIGGEMARMEVVVQPKVAGQRMQGGFLRMITRRSVLLGCGAFCAAEALADAESAREVVLRSVGQDTRNERIARNYTYKALNRIRELDSAGNVKATHSTLEEVLYVGGKDYFHPLEKDGKSLQAAEAKKEEAKLDRAVKEASAMPEAERKKREEERVARRVKERERLRYVPDGFDFTIEGTSMFNGREAWQIRARPRRDYKGPYAFLYRNMEGTLWIDRQDYQWVKVEADVRETISLGWFLARIEMGTRISFERMKVNGELWAATHVELRASARLALLKKVNAEQEITFSDYRKFAADSRMVDDR